MISISTEREMHLFNINAIPIIRWSSTWRSFLARPVQGTRLKLLAPYRKGQRAFYILACVAMKSCYTAHRKSSQPAPTISIGCPISNNGNGSRHLLVLLSSISNVTAADRDRVYSRSLSPYSVSHFRYSSIRLLLLPASTSPLCRYR